MKTIKIMVAVMMFVALTAGFAGAGDPIGDITVTGDVKNTINNSANSSSTSTSNATGGNANATGGNAVVDHSGNSSVKGSGNSILTNNIVTPLQPYEMGTTIPMSAGQAMANGAWFLFMSNVIDCLTFKQATNLKDSLSWTIFSRLDYAPMEEGFAKTKSIKILGYYGKKPGDVVVGFTRVFGKRKDITETLVALAGIEGMNHGATGMSVRIRVKNETNSKGLTINGSGGASLQIPCTGSVGSGMSLGAYLSSTTIDDKIEMEIVYLVMGYEPPVSVFVPPAPPVYIAPPPVVVAPAPPKVCDPAWFLAQIEIWKEACRHCGDPCFNNEMLRYNTGNYYTALYDCTKDMQYLVLAIEEYDKGERDCLNGHEPDGTETRTMEGARKVLYSIRYNKSFAIRILHHDVKAQHGYAKQNGLKSVPSKYEDIRH